MANGIRAMIANGKKATVLKLVYTCIWGEASIQHSVACNLKVARLENYGERGLPVGNLTESPTLPSRFVLDHLVALGPC